ncbi:YrhB domain-containing protein [Gordonia sp. DT218]|uniref:YrhB domain-containing protein n=1 Tax=Gordonia sp. DT218 TaxID=3416659 RepID=UPI003CF6BE17
MTIDYSQALDIAQREVDKMGNSIGTALVLIESSVHEAEDAWYFPYNSRDLIEKNDILSALAGNLPIKVFKDGSGVVLEAAP